MEQIEIYKIEVDVDKAKQDLISYQVAIEKVKKEKKALEDANKKGEISEEEYAKTLIETNAKLKSLTDAQKNANKQIELATKATNTNVNSYESLSIQLSEAQKALKSMGNAFTIAEDGSIELTEEYKAQQAEVLKLKESILAFDAGIKDGKTNIGNYASALSDSLGNTKLFGVGINDAKKGLSDFASGGVKGVITQLGELSKVILANPIGIIAVAAIALFQAFQRTQKGTEFLQKAMALLGEGIDFALKPLDMLIDGLVGFLDVAIKSADALKDFFGIKSDENESAKSAYELEEALINVEKQLKKNEVENKRAISNEEKLKQIRDDESKGLEARIKANKEVGELEAKRLEKGLKLENEKLSILEEQLANTSNTKKQEEIKGKIQEQQIKVLELQEEAAGRMTEQITNQNSLLKEQSELRTANKQAELELAVVTGKIAEGSAQQLEAQKKIIKERLETQLKGVQEGTDEEKSIRLAADLEIAKLNKDFNEKQASNYKDYSDKIKGINEARINADRTKTQDELATSITLIEKQLNDFDVDTAKADDKNTELLRQRALDRIDIEQVLLEKKLALIRENQRVELEEAKKQEKELNKVGLDGASFYAAEKKRIVAQTELEISQAQNEIILKRIETEKANLQAQLTEQRQEKLKALEIEQLDAQNDLMMKRLRNEEAAKEEQLLNEANYNIQREQLLQQQQNDEISYQEYLTRLTAASITYEQEKTRIETEEAQKRLEAERQLSELRLGIVKDFTEASIAVAGENEEAQKALFALQKTVALFEVGINLQQELSKENVAASSLNALLPGAGEVYRVAAIVRAVARGAKIISEIKKATFAEGGYTGNSQLPIDQTGQRPAGIVHENEYVIPAWQVSKNIPLINSLERQRLRGYASGGLVAASSELNSIANTKEQQDNLLKSIENIKIYTDIQEVRDTIKKVEVVEQKATL